MVLGISPDPVAKVKKFHDKQGLNFALLADEGHRVADAYGVWVREVDVRQNVLRQRAHHVRDRLRTGEVAEVLRKVKPAEHDELVLAALQELSPPAV